MIQSSLTKYLRLGVEKDFDDYFSVEKCLAERSQGDYAQRDTDANKEVMFEAFNLHKKVKHYPKIINIHNSYRLAQNQAKNDDVIENKTIELESLDVVLKPNPANDNFAISTNKIIDYIQITDALGKEVLEIKNYASNSIINTNNLSSGLYFVKINAVNGSTYKRLIISK
jgi:hypothetical protein